MNDSSKLLLQRIVRRIPVQMLKTTLDKWGRLTVEQRQAIDFTQSKWALTQKLQSFCEVPFVIFLCQKSVVISTLSFNTLLTFQPFVVFCPHRKMK